MSARLSELGARRELLVARSERLRLDLAKDAVLLGGRFRIANRVLALARSGAGRAGLVGTAALVLFTRPRWLLSTAGRLLVLWPLLRPLLPRLARLWRDR